MIYLTIQAVLALLNIMILVLAISNLLRSMPRHFTLPWLITASRAFSILIIVKSIVWFALGIWAVDIGAVYTATYYDMMWLIAEYLNCLALMLILFVMHVFREWVSIDPETGNYKAAPKRRKEDFVDYAALKQYYHEQEERIPDKYNNKKQY